ncbi:MAG: hypothetical protein IJX77_10470 [Ruminococcus sp.]|nr:hypothetical protein [Ruminococcus sp.]
MKKKILTLNVISGVFYVISSLSLLAIPVLSSGEKISSAGYVIAAVFWAALLVGTVMQIIISVMCRKLELKKCTKQRAALIPAAVFLVLLVVMLLFKNDSLILMSADLALLLLSVEAYFLLKRRFSL